MHQQTHLQNSSEIHLLTAVLIHPKRTPPEQILQTVCKTGLFFREEQARFAEFVRFVFLVGWISEGFDRHGVWQFRLRQGTTQKLAKLIETLAKAE